MPTLNVCVQIYMIKKNTQNHKKYKYFSSFQKLCLRVCACSLTKNIGGRVYFGCGVLLWASHSRPRCDWVLRREGSNWLSKSLYLGIIDNILQIDHDRAWEGHLVWYRGDSDMFRDMWDKRYLGIINAHLILL